MVKINCKLKKNRNKSVCQRNISNNKCKEDIGESRFSLIIPKRDNSSKPIKPKLIQKYIKEMNNIFGGSSAIPRIEGCVVDENNKGKFQCEQSIEIVGVRDFENPYDKKYGDDLSKSSCEERKKILKEDWSKVKILGEKARKEFGQESILAIHDKINDAHFSFGDKLSKLPKKRIGKKVIFP